MTTDWIGKRYWIIGASEGIGRALAERLGALGVNLVLSARSTDRLDELAASLPRKADVVPVDVTDAASVKAAVEAVGEIDGMIYVSGTYWPMTAQDWNAEQVETMIDVNLTGAARVLGHVVPWFVARDRGHIVLTGSLAGYRGLPGAIGYGASKAGLMSLGESLQADLRGTGVKVQIASPGFVKTRLTEKNDFTMPFIMTPEEAAHEYVELMMSDAMSRSFPTLFSWILRLTQLLPDWIYFPLFARKG